MWKALIQSTVFTMGEPFFRFGKSSCPPDPAWSRLDIQLFQNDFHIVSEFFTFFQLVLDAVDAVDDIGTIHVRWDNGSGLGIVPGVDTVRKVTGISGSLKEQILQVRDTGLVNMFDVKGVREVAEALDLDELVEYLDSGAEGYARFILYGG